MFYILLSWFYIFFIGLGMGSFIFYVGKFKNIHLSFLIISGLFFQLLFITFYSSYLPINKNFYLLNIFISLTILYKKRIKVLQILKNSIILYSGWKRSIKVFFIVLIIITLMGSSIAPTIIDNESYYIQTIKWINEYGLVKGLANLHIFLGQMSGWHLLQSSFNFAFWVDFLNDLNGFLLIVIAFFSFNKLNHFLSFKNDFMDLFSGIIFTSFLFFFQFLNSPSPDLIIYLLSPVIIYLFYKNYLKVENNDIILIVIFCLLLISVKATVFPIIIFPSILWIKNSKKRGIVAPLIIFFGVSLLLFCFKNYIISGYIFYPTPLFSSLLSIDWKIDPRMQTVFYDSTRLQPFSTMNLLEYQQWTITEKFLRWFFAPKLYGFFNKMVLFVLILMPFFIRKNKALFWIYIYSLLQFGLLFFTALHYRLFFHVILILSLLMFSLVMFRKNSKLTTTILLISVLLPSILLFFSINHRVFSNNNLIYYSNVFHYYYIIKPHKNSQYTYEYEKIKEENLLYNSPKNIPFWFTGDGDLPVVNKVQIEFFKKKYQIKPVLRNKELKDGFRIEKIKQYGVK